MLKYGMVILPYSRTKNIWGTSLMLRLRQSHFCLQEPEGHLHRREKMFDIQAVWNTIQCSRSSGS